MRPDGDFGMRPKSMIGWQRFDRKHVQSRTGNLPTANGIKQIGLDQLRATAAIDDIGAFGKLIEKLVIHNASCCRC